eukprot:NODE_2776_length_1495_cov_38.548105_g2397_i0.p1 GENE.NODE_2776_length_1495_cov_38.548105_g2397_i0~~NODE_2776_length_1495_cov_38.548105_g2397_i0.p1  ORF type:complete len:412 (-),score=29.81 NODE_2776_length_1495_cov_38.548105_g2397_i0:198-1433(-)
METLTSIQLRGNKNRWRRLEPTYEHKRTMKAESRLFFEIRSIKRMLLKTLATQVENVHKTILVQLPSEESCLNDLSSEVQDEPELQDTKTYDAQKTSQLPDDEHFLDALTPEVEDSQNEPKTDDQVVITANPDDSVLTEDEIDTNTNDNQSPTQACKPYQCHNKVNTQASQKSSIKLSSINANHTFSSPTQEPSCVYTNKSIQYHNKDNTQASHNHTFTSPTHDPSCVYTNKSIQCHNKDNTQASHNTSFTNTLVDSQEPTSKKINHHHLLTRKRKSNLYLFLNKRIKPNFKQNFDLQSPLFNVNIINKNDSSNFVSQSSDIDPFDNFKICWNVIFPSIKNKPPLSLLPTNIYPIKQPWDTSTYDPYPFDWRCSNCFFINFTKRDHCFSCRMNKSSVFLFGKFNKKPTLIV